MYISNYPSREISFDFWTGRQKTEVYQKYFNQTFMPLNQATGKKADNHKI